MASSHDGTCPHDLLQGLVAGTSPLVCADLKREKQLTMKKISYGISLSKRCKELAHWPDIAIFGMLFD